MTRDGVPEPGGGSNELNVLWRQSRRVVGFVALLSLFSSLLMLTGPLYMLQVYDRVLSSGSEATLVSLTLLAAFLFGMMGLLDWTRGRLMARVGARFDLGLRGRVFDLMLSGGGGSERGAAARRDLDAVQRALAAPVMLALFDLPWVPIFMLGIWIFHPWLGALALGGALALVAISVAHQVSIAAPGARAVGHARRVETCAANAMRAAETVRGLGMRSALRTRLGVAMDETLEARIRVSDRSGGFTALSRTTRLFLQSAMLGLGALLVLDGQLSAGAMIAGSILLGRALMPLEQVIAQWSTLDQARLGWRDLRAALSSRPVDTPRTPLPRPRAHVQVQQLTVVPPDAEGPTLRGVSFAIEPGEVLGVLGPSGAGKSTLARALTGLWPATWGKVRLDGAPLEQYEPDEVGRLIGYLPQRVELFGGTIAENIARMDAEPDASGVIQAARRAGVHEMILEQPRGYDTVLDDGGAPLSGGQAQRIGLARALYGDPVLLILDEPGAHLDAAGHAAVDRAIRTVTSEGGAVVIMAHGVPELGACELLLVLENGLARAFGPRDRVLEQVADRLTPAASPMGAVAS